MHRKLWGKKTTQKQFISPNSKPMQTQKYNGEKTASSISGAGETGQAHVKNEIRTLPNTVHKDKLKMDYRPKCNIKNYKTLRGKHRQNTL